METTLRAFSRAVGAVRMWISGQSEPSNLSRDFWMPDQSCLVCYECDSQFTLFNRRHHCRLCGRVFCGKCTANSVPGHDDGERIRVCNYCHRQWEQGGVSVYNCGVRVPNSGFISPSPSALSFASAHSSANFTSSSVTLASMPYSFGPYQHSQRGSGHSSFASSFMEASLNGESASTVQGRISDLVMDRGDLSAEQRRVSINSVTRSEDGDSEYSMYRMDSETMQFSSVNAYCNRSEFGEMSHDDGLHKVHPYTENMDSRSSSFQHSRFDSQDLGGLLPGGRKDDEHDMGEDCEASSSVFIHGNGDGNDTSKTVDFEDNGLLWLPPEPEDEEDEKDPGLFDDDDDYGNEPGGEWGYLRSSSSFGSGESRIRDKSGEEQKNAMKNVVDGHFRALVAQLLQVENLITGEEEESESWLEIVTSLSWEAATLLKPDMSKGGGMDPGGYVKVKCLASGRRCESMVVKGVVCKKNVAHRRMTAKIQKPRIFILGGALEYQRVTNHLSSFDTLLQQEMDHLKMAVAKIDAHNPDLLLVEKSVSRFAQEYLLEKDISLVLNMKRPLLERISRCTGSPILTSIDHLSAQKLGYCERFRVERSQEDLGTAGQDGKKTVKTLMYFEGCPKPLGCTILLRGANGDELKKVKHVVQYGVFAAYHLALETSFLADEGAALPELLFKSPLPVGILDKSNSLIHKSISSVFDAEPQRANSVPASDLSSCIIAAQSFSKRHSLPTNAISFISAATSENNTPPNEEGLSDAYSTEKEERVCSFGEKNEAWSVESRAIVTPSTAGHSVDSMCNNPEFKDSSSLGESQKIVNDLHVITKSPVESSEESAAVLQEDPEALREPFPPSPSDHQSILVSLSSRCIWKGTVCERSHLFRIKYYGSFDKPLGRFLRDHLFDQTYQCHSCEMPSEAHVQCYTHRQGTLTISVKKLPGIILPGEKEGKIWMWHRCLRCPRTDGFPPATRRIVMSDAAWGLSFGKFLELSFSNHAAASRVASCGHSLHRDCLRFYGFGKMVACFRYASIDVLSVHLPPSKLDFFCGNQEWIQKETDKVVDRVELLFSEALNALSQIAEKRSGPGVRTPESRRKIAEFEEYLQMEKQEFEESLLKTLNKEPKKGQPLIDILDIDRLRRQLLFQSYMWDRRLIYAASLDNHGHRDQLSRSISEPEDKSVVNSQNIAEKSVPIKTGKGYNSFDSFLVDEKNSQSFEFPVLVEGSGNRSNLLHPNPSYEIGDKIRHSPSTNSFDQPEPLANMRKTRSEGEFRRTKDLSDTFDAAWTGNNHTGIGSPNDDTGALSDSAIEENSVSIAPLAEKQTLEQQVDEHPEFFSSFSNLPSAKVSENNMEDSVSWLSMPFVSFYRSLNKSHFASSQIFEQLREYNPVYVSAFRESDLQGGARLLLPLGVNDTAIPVFDDEPTSIIAYALVSQEYHHQLSDDGERLRDSTDSLFSSFSDSLNFQSFLSTDETVSESFKSFGSVDENMLSTKSLHVRVSFGESGLLSKVKYSVTCYYAKRFEALRRICCPSECDFIRSLSRCKKWGAQGGKSNVFFAKTLDDRFIIKQVTKTELESFIKFAPEYFRYLSESISTGSPTCLAKILGIYQVTTKHLKGGRETKMDVLVMENLLYGRNVTRLYDLKGSSRSRYNSDVSGRNKVLLDQNLIEAMPTSPIFLGTKAKRSLERAVWNDTAFLASIDVMDYSLLVGLDEDNHELVLGIIDFMRQYTWDKHLETWVKTSGILGGPKNASPTVISPKQYKKRFRKAMTTYFLMVPDQWFPTTMIQSQSQSDFADDNYSQGVASVE